MESTVESVGEFDMPADISTETTATVEDPNLEGFTVPTENQPAVPPVETTDDNDGLNDDGTFKIPGEEDKTKLQDIKEVKEFTGSWKDLAKDVIGEELTDEITSYQDFVAKAQERVNAKIEQERSKITENPIEVLKTIDEEFANLYEFKKNGGELKNYYNSFNEIDNFISLPDEKLLEEEFKTYKDSFGRRLYSDSEIQNKIMTLVEEDKIGSEAKQLREQLYNVRKDIEVNIIEEQKAAQQFKIEQENLKIEQKANEVSKILSGTNEFLGGKLEQKHKDYVLSQYKQKHQELLNDPKAIAEFMLFKTFGEQALKRKNEAEFQKGKDKIKQELHNVPPINSGAGRQSSDMNPKDFSAWANVKPVEVEFKN